MPVQGPFQEHIRRDQLAEPADERPFALRHRRGHCASPVHGGLHSQQGGAPLQERRVARQPGVAIQDELRGQPAVVHARRQVRGGAPCQPRHGKAVVRPLARRQDLKASPRDRRFRPHRAHGIRRQARLEHRQLARRHICHQADVLKLGVALQRVHRFRPAVEVGRRRVRVAGDERAGADHEVFLVLDRHPQIRGDLRGGRAKRKPRFGRFGAGHGACAEHRPERSRHQQHRHDGGPDAGAPAGQRLHAPTPARSRARP